MQAGFQLQVKDNIGSGRTYMKNSNFDAEVSAPSNLSLFSTFGSPVTRVVGQKSDIWIQYILRAGLGTRFKIKLTFQNLDVSQASVSGVPGQASYALISSTATSLDLDVTLAASTTGGILLQVTGMINNVSDRLIVRTSHPVDRSLPW